MTDYWKLNDLFKFDNRKIRIYNDSDNPIDIKDDFNKIHTLESKAIIEFGKGKDLNFDIPNNEIYNFSDNSIHKVGNFEENLYSIILQFTNNLNDGQIIKGIDFLDYHYKWSKHKKRLVKFVKYYIASKSWIDKNKKSDYTINDWAIDDWIKEKELNLRRPKYLAFVLALIGIFILGAIFWCDYSELFIGALIGGLTTQIDKLIDYMRK